MSLDIVVLAAGQGKRMHSTLPKVLHRVAGRPMLAHVLETARSLAPGRIIVVHGHGGDVVRAAFAAMDVTWIEQAEQLGTGHALMQALPSVKPRDDVLVLYGDVPLIRAETLRALIEAKDTGLAMLSAELSDPSGYGRIVRDAQGRVTRIVEEKDASAEERALREVNVGFLVAQAARLTTWLASVKNRNAQQEYYLTDVVQRAVAEGVTVATRQPKDVWEVWGVNSRYELALVERAFQNAVAKRLLEAGVSLADLWRIDVRGDLRCGHEVSIDVNCVFEGKVSLGDRVRIGPNCVLRNVTIAADTEVHAFSHLEEAQIGARCRVGPYARLRPGAALAEDVHVGNFVEIKASRLGARSKANHLSYVGDAEVGRGVNIGAGTITCNYDGAAKHRTVIGDECFIGSDTTLVAPVTLARGSYIGAGSTISKDTPPDQLTVARARQVTVRGWKPPRKN
jgi:bifunctional UDP-N-acetylglucosamine pyrophosphorylase / glucosamine-1-phosphate N-acetyltransferase